MLHGIDDTPAGSNFDIFFAASNNNGTSFGTPINLSNNTGVSANPQIAASGTMSMLHGEIPLLATLISSLQ